MNENEAVRDRSTVCLMDCSLLLFNSSWLFSWQNIFLINTFSRQKLHKTVLRVLSREKLAYFIKLHHEDIFRSLVFACVKCSVVFNLTKDIARGEKWHFTNFTGEPKQTFYHSLIWLCVLISIVYNKNLYTHGWQYFSQ